MHLSENYKSANLYAGRTTHGLSEDAEDGVLILLTRVRQQLLNLLLFPREQRNTLPLAAGSDHIQPADMLESHARMEENCTQKTHNHVDNAILFRNFFWI